uniref:Lipase n=1 Tax=Stomoxys calcitrans TaxID=35570 RepID=A0A1I8Q818_STOCA
MNFLLLAWVILATFLESVRTQSYLTTCDRVRRHGYPCDTHSVTTADGYILTMFRVPHAHYGDAQMSAEGRPVVFLMHCLLGSSDIWVLNGPETALPFVLADAGYDVWMGNARGNVYSENHISLSSSSPEFWSFALDEIGVIDLPAKLDYVMKQTQQKKLHYVGYSQGTTAFMMALSTIPRLNGVMKTSHLLAPVAFMCHMKSPAVRVASEFFGKPNALADFLGTLPVQGVWELLRGLGPTFCKNQIFSQFCVAILNFITGWDSPYLNRTLLPDIIQTLPAGGSNRQIFQYMQSFISCHFRAYDLGLRGNMERYGKPYPPDYKLENIHPESPIQIYYSDNDFFVSLEDVQRLHKIIGNKASWHRIQFDKFNHFDFTLSYNVKSCVNSCVVDKIQEYEGRPFNGSMCDHFKPNVF